MMPKLHNCFESLKKGVQEVRIGNSSIFSQKINLLKLKSNVESKSNKIITRFD